MIDLARLTPMEVASRADLLRERFDHLGIDALAVTNLTNVRWLTGFTGSHGAVLVSHDQLILFTDGRYEDQAPDQLAAAGVDAVLRIGTDLVAGIADTASDGARLGLEADHATWQVLRRLDDPARTLVPVVGELVELRSRKDAGEIARIRAAAQIADATLAEAAPIVAARHADLNWTGGERILAQEDDNETLYQFGYLAKADDLCFWDREYLQMANLAGNTPQSVPSCF